jgi:hypothetical protein
MSWATYNIWYLFGALLVPVAAFGADSVYKSVDKLGRVTYSSQPPKDAVDMESVPISPGPSATETKAAQERAGEIAQEVDAWLKERRLQAEQARKEAREAADREELAQEAAERQRRIDDSLDRLANEQDNYRGYPYDWRWPHRPPHPVYPLHPPGPPRRAMPPNRPYRGHINSPALKW